MFDNVLDLVDTVGIGQMLETSAWRAQKLRFGEDNYSLPSHDALVPEVVFNPLRSRMSEAGSPLLAIWFVVCPLARQVVCGPQKLISLVVECDPDLQIVASNL